MMVDTAIFVAGIGVLVTLDVLSIGLIYDNTRNLGVDNEARHRAQEAKETAEAAHRRIDDCEQTH